MHTRQLLWLIAGFLSAMACLVVTRVDTAVAGASMRPGMSAMQAPLEPDAAKVWANADARVYYCAGEPWYGKTGRGEYLTEFDANARGFIPGRGTPCVR